MTISDHQEVAMALVAGTDLMTQVPDRASNNRGPPDDIYHLDPSTRATSVTGS